MRRGSSHCSADNALLRWYTVSLDTDLELPAIPTLFGLQADCSGVMALAREFVKLLSRSSTSFNLRGSLRQLSMLVL
jgi:hypothetical protein